MVEIPQLEELAELEAKETVPRRRRLTQESVTDRKSAQVVGRLTGISVNRLVEGEQEDYSSLALPYMNASLVRMRQLIR